MNKKIVKDIRRKPLHKKLGLAHKKHTGRRLANKHTSYGALFAILLLLLAPNLMITRGVNGVVTSSGNVLVTATVPGPAPTIPATITSPTTGSTSTVQAITVAGTCGPDLLVKVFRNNIFAGSTFCDSSGHFSLTISLYTGRNDLTALNYDTLDQAGPVSPTVTVTYKPNTSKPQINLLLEADYHLRQVSPNTDASWTYNINLGAPPYTIKVDWGDGNTETQSQPTNGQFVLTHLYSASGRYLIHTTVTDANGASTSVQLAVTVNGPEPVVTSSAKKTSSSTCSSRYSSWFGKLYCSSRLTLAGIWLPLYWLLLIIIGFIWLLKRLQKRATQQRQQTAH